MPQILVEDFNSYTNGDLNGQGSWTGTAAMFTVQGTTVYEGAKAIQCVVDASSKNISKVGTATPTGSLTVYIRPVAIDTTNRFIFYLFEGGTPVMQIGFYGDGATKQIQYVNAGSWTQIGTETWAANTWYKVNIEWRASDSFHQVNVDDHAWTTWAAGAASWTTGPNKVYIATQNNVEAYFDNIGPAAAAAAGNNAVMFGTNF